MSPDQTRALVEILPALLAAGGVFLATFYLVEGAPRRETFNTWSYGRQFIDTLRDLAGERGLQLAVLDDLQHPNPMLRTGQLLRVLRVSAGTRRPR